MENNIQWGVFSARAAGAPHLRERLFIVAKSNSERCGTWGDHREERYVQDNIDRNAEEGKPERSGRIGGSCEVGANVAHANTGLLSREKKQVRAGRDESESGGKDLAYSSGIGQQGSWWSFDPFDTKTNGEGEVDRAFYDSRWGIESPVGRVANGVAHRVDRLKAIGNGQVSSVVERAWRELSK